jgi:hypothetical protein
VAQSLLRRCLHCKELFRPNPGNRWHQEFCLEPACRKASKAQSQRRWLAKPSNQDYFRGPANVERVHQWRKRNPRYWKGQAKAPSTLQDFAFAQTAEEQVVAKTTSPTPLQDVVAAQDPLLVGLICQLLDSPLQDSVEQTTLRLLSHGLDFLDMRSRNPTKRNNA